MLTVVDLEPRRPERRLADADRQAPGPRIELRGGQRIAVHFVRKGSDPCRRPFGHRRWPRRGDRRQVRRGGHSDLHDEALLGEHRTARAERGQHADASADGAVVAPIGEPHRPLLPAQRAERTGGERGAIGGDDRDHRDLGPVAEQPVEDVEHLRTEGVVELGAERGETVEQDHDPRQRAAGDTVQGPSAVEFVAQLAHETHLALTLAAGDDGTGVRKLFEHPQITSAEIEGVEVEIGRRSATGRRCRDRHEGRRHPRTDQADDHEVAVGHPPAERVLRLTVRVVGQGDRYPVALVRAVRPHVGKGERGRQRIGPRAPRRGQPRRGEAVAHGGDEPGEVGRSVTAQWASDRRRPVELVRRDLDWRKCVIGGGGRRQRRLYRHDLPRPEADVGPTGSTARDRRSVGRADDVARIARVLDAQCDAQVGVRPDVVADRSRRPLGGEDHVHAEAAPALRHADDGVHELGQLRLERGELVDDEHKAGHRLTVWVGPQVARQVAHTCVTQPAFAVAELGLHAPQRPLPETGVEVGDHAHGVRQVRTLEEGRAALVVDEHEGEVRRIGVRRH